tara:strand:- start:4640 stop:5752 length:1113 start_codon:yes stop_codon:yes gene_type:complete
MKLILKLIVLIIFCQSCTNSIKSEGYKINVQIKNIKDSSKVYLYNYENINTVDSTFVINEHFTFEGKVDYPSIALINIDDRLGFSFWLENDEIDLITTDEELNLQGYGKELLSLKGGYINKLSKEYNQLQLTNDNLIISTKIKELRNNTNSIHSKRTIDSLNKILNDKAFSFFIKKPDNFFSLSKMAANLKTYSKDSLELYYNLLSSELKISKKGRTLSEFIFTKPIMIGEKFIDIKGVDLYGNTVKLSDFKNKVILLDFWAGWCAPCVKKIKSSFSKFSQIYKNEDFIIVSFSLDFENLVWSRTSKKLKIDWPNFSNLKGFGENPVQIDYGVYSIPTSFIIDKNGIITHRLDYDDNIEKELNKIFSREE